MSTPDPSQSKSTTPRSPSNAATGDNRKLSVSQKSGASGTSNVSFQSQQASNALDVSAQSGVSAQSATTAPISPGTGTPAPEPIAEVASTVEGAVGDSRKASIAPSEAATAQESGFNDSQVGTESDVDGLPPHGPRPLNQSMRSSLHSQSMASIPVERPQEEDDMEYTELTEEQVLAEQEQARFRENNAAKLGYRTILGYVHQPPKGRRVVVGHAEDDMIMYQAGRHLTYVKIAATAEDPQYNRMLMRNETCIEINTFAVSHSGRYVAVSERCADAPHVSIHKIDSGSRVTHLNFKYLSKTQVVEMSFSNNNKYLATVTGGNSDAKLIMWQLDEVKVIGVVDLPSAATAVMVSPWSHLEMCTTGPNKGHFYVWKLADRSMTMSDPVSIAKRFPLQDPKFIAHTWYDDHCVAAVTATGALVAVDGVEIACVLRCDAHVEAGTNFNSIVWASRGIIVGGDNGTMLLYDRTYGDPAFRFVAVFHSACRTSPIVAMSISPNEQNVVVAHANNTMAYCDLETFNDILEENLAEAEEAANPTRSPRVSPRLSPIAAESSSSYSRTVSMGAPGDAEAPLRIDDIGFQPMRHVGFHSDFVTSASLALQRPYLLTSSNDRSMRIYDIEAGQTVATKLFEEEVLSCAINPLGLHIVACFRFYSRIYAVLKDAVHYCADINVKPAHEVRFSKGGHVLVFCVQQRVHVHDAHSLNQLAVLTGHAQMVKSVAFSHKDSVLTSCDLGGIILTWSMGDFKRLAKDTTAKTLMFQAAVYDDHTGMLAAVGTNKHATARVVEGEFTITASVPGNDENIVMVRPGMVLPKHLAMRKQHMFPIAIGNLSQTLFVGTPTGRLLLYTFPLLTGSKPYAQTDAHSGEILQLLLTPDERYLISIGVDNIMYIYDVESMKAGKYVSLTPFPYALFDNIGYALLSDLDDKYREQLSLRRRIEEKTGENNAQLSLLRMEQDSAMKAMVASQAAECAALQKELDAAINERLNREGKIVKHIDKLEALHVASAEEIENLYNRRMDEASQRYLGTKAERDELVVRYENKLTMIERAFESEKAQLEAKRKDREAELLAEVEVHRRRNAERALVGETMVSQSVVDYEGLLQQMAAEHVVKVQALEEQAARAINVASIGDREAERLRKEKVALEAQLEGRQDVIAALQAKVDKKKKETEFLKKEMYARQEVINASEKRMQALKQQTTVLENLRFVLTHQFEELRNEVEPKDLRIRDLDLRIQAMDDTLSGDYDAREELKRMLLETEETLKAKTVELQKCKLSVMDGNREVENLIARVSQLVTNADSGEVTKKRLKKVIKDFTPNGLILQPTKEQQKSLASLKAVEEIKEHTEQISDAVDDIRTNLHKRQKAHSLKMLRGMEQNSGLVREIADLRQDRRELHQICLTGESHLRDARIALHRVAHPGLFHGPSLPTSALALISSPVPATPLPAIAASPADQSKASATGGKLPPMKKRGSDASPLAGIREKWEQGRKGKLPPHVIAAEIQTMVGHLEANTERMRAQRREIEDLRGCVQELLQLEEVRLMDQLRHVQPSGMSRPSPTPGPTHDSTLDESPDWGSPAPDATRGRPMTPTDLPH